MKNVIIKVSYLGAPRNTPPPSGHSAVSAPQPGPIPTQTFTSQTFPGVPPMPNVATPMFPTHPVPTPTQVPVSNYFVKLHMYREI